ncbi:MAG: PhoH family protein [Anaerovoracaceae bacterium]
MENIVRIIIHDAIDRSELFGNMDKNIKTIKDNLKVDIIQRDNELVIKGDDADKAESLVNELIGIISAGEKIDTQKILYVLNLVEKGLSYKDSSLEKDVVCFTHMGKPLKAKTIGQKKYIEAMRKNDIVFGIGPAGTGKTYLAVAMAIAAYKRKEVERIILARPAVEAGERLGFLPGDLQEKVDPYLRPLYDALFDVLGKDTATRLKEKEVIEVVPLAYMRGRTLDNSFIILDEAQNTTKEQMKMFLTRMGFGSKMVITGDVTQIDLPRGKKSGLVEAARILKGLKEIQFCYLKDIDVVRHHLVRIIIGAYDKYYRENPGEEEWN